MGDDADPARDKLIAVIEQLIRERVAPVAAERGGDLRVKSVHCGVVQLEISGSPGATLPLRSQIAALVHHHVDPTLEIELVLPDVACEPQTENLAERVATLLHDQINPAIAAHRGEIQLQGIEQGIVHVTMAGGCQGCAMAEVTLRQGVATILKERIPEVVAVVDETDHAAGEQPYFRTRKGT